MRLDAFMPGLAKFQEYLLSLRSPSEFSGPNLLEIMSTFQESFEAHMCSEVSCIAALAQHPKTPKEGSEEERKTQGVFDAREGQAIIKAGVTDVLPFFLFNFDSEYEDGIWRDWPPIPAPVRWGLMGVARVMHSGWWKFASCDAGRRKKELYAVGE